MRSARRSTIVVLHLAAVSTMLVAAASPASAQRRSATVRRGAPGAAITPTAEASITLGASTYEGSVDASCTRNERARAGTAGAYYHVLYPWFGARPAPGQPEWRFELIVPRPTRAGDLDAFVFHFSDGTRRGTIQTLPGSERMGSGTVRVTPHGAGARFDVEGRGRSGESIRATIDCASFPRSEGAGG